MFLSNQELRQIRHDYEKLLQSPEACPIKLRYRRDLGGGVADETPIDKNIRAIHKVVTALDLKNMKDRILEIGDSLFFFSSSVNMAMPNGADAVMDGSLQIVDSA